MKTGSTLFVLAAVLAIAAAVDQLVLDDRLIESVNLNAKATWVAGENPVFVGKTMSQIRHMFGAFLLDREVTSMQALKISFNDTAQELPKQFDSRQEWSDCKTIGNIRNQGTCGSCWAFSGAEVLSDRFCIATKGKVNYDLSPQDMVSCDSSNLACKGGYLDRLWKYLENTGIVSDDCLPYKSGAGDIPECPTTCSSAGAAWIKHKAVKSIMYDSIEDAQKDISKYGPIMTGFKVYRDFLSYKSGVYKHVSGGFAGGHAVKVIGWGVDSKTNTPYWIAVNSWGTGWGMNGLFWIAKGTDECDFESNMIAGQAAVLTN